MTIKGVHKTRQVFIDEEQLVNPDSLMNKTQFMWGYTGSGPKNLAYALLLHFSADRDFAVQYYPKLVSKVIAKLPQDDFEMDAEVVIKFIAQHRSP